jgi:hypothetical protein
MYPKNDKQFEIRTIDKVKESGDSWEVTWDDGWCFFIPADSPIKPQKGMKARLYGRGTGSRVRGLFLDGIKVYYNTEKEDGEIQEIQLYGRDAQDWLDRWDKGEGVWSIEMGGMGPGYEQAIQITAAELLRRILERKYDKKALQDKNYWKLCGDELHEYSMQNKAIKKLGLSGAQYGAALNIAIRLYLDGPRKIMKNEQIKDRHIQVSKNFPG